MKLMAKVLTASLAVAVAAGMGLSATAPSPRPQCKGVVKCSLYRQ